jgi:hypothetical protein
MLNVKNLRAATSLLSAIPAADWNLSHFMRKDDDGDVTGCALGWLATFRFAQMEMKYGAPSVEVRAGEHCYEELGMGCARLLFGLSTKDSCYLFGQVHANEWEDHAGNHKKIWFARLRRLMSDNGVWFREMFGVDEPTEASSHERRRTDSPIHTHNGM